MPDANVGIGTTSPQARLEVYQSGGTVLDIQGSQGQLFSVTDDLTGTLFAVSDVSGIPILEVDDSGTVGIAQHAYYDTSSFYDLSNWWHIAQGSPDPQFYSNGTYQGNLYMMGSDYRIKQDVQDLQDGAIDRVKLIRTVSYRNKSYNGINFDESITREGFIAHELQEIIPSAVTYEKDDPKFIQQLRIDSVVAVLTKAIQEQQSIIESLQSRIQTLENS